MADVTYLSPAGEPPCDVCRRFPAEVLVVTSETGLRMCVPCAAADVVERQARARGEVHS